MITIEQVEAVQLKREIDNLMRRAEVLLDTLDAIEKRNPHSLWTKNLKSQISLVHLQIKISLAAAAGIMERDEKL